MFVVLTQEKYWKYLTINILYGYGVQNDIDQTSGCETGAWSIAPNRSGGRRGAERHAPRRPQRRYATVSARRAPQAAQPRSGKARDSSETRATQDCAAVAAA